MIERYGGRTLSHYRSLEGATTDETSWLGAPLQLITGLPDRAVAAAAHAHGQLTDYVLPERPDDEQQDRPATTPVATANRHDQSTALVRFPLVTSASSLPSASTDPHPDVTDSQPGAGWGEGPRQTAM